ncbi:MAG: AAA family ATPase [Methanobacterium sp.]|uniref:AAA family ATPase n=1 Tax=Methanobacterium sp. TaxID=2164 RepID=UPI003D656290|nr:AAA family ATPase [Methanobacterium sp.]
MELPYNVVIVTGVPGVGKTTICRRISGTLGYEYVNYGDLMLSIAKSRDLASTDIEMFSLDMETQHEIWKSTALKIKEKKNVLVDLHGVDQSLIGYIISLPVEIIKPDIIFVIESLEDKILKQRNKDTKIRIVDNIKSLKEHMGILRNTMAICSVLFACNLVIMKNDDLEECLNKMENILNNSNTA